MLIYYRLKYISHLSETEKVIKNYILENMEKTSTMSQSQLADEIHCSLAAISRFIKKLEFKNYKDFQIHLVKEIYSDVHKEATIDYNFPFSKNDTQYMIADNLASLYHDVIDHALSLIDVEDLHQAVKLIYNAKFIDVYAVTNNVHIALNFQDKMQTIGRYVNVSMITQTQRFMALASNHEHAAIIISYSGKTPEMIDISRILKKNKTPILVICSPQDNPILKIADYHLYTTDREDMNIKISYFASHIAAQYVLDYLFACIFQKDFEKNMDYHLNSYNLLDPRQ